MKYEIRHQDRDPLNLPDGWSFLGDVMLGNLCQACLFVDDGGRLRVRPEGAAWDHARHVIQFPVRD